MPIFDTDGAVISYEMLGRIAPEPDSEVTVTGRLYAEDRKSTRLNSSHWNKSRMPSSA